MIESVLFMDVCVYGHIFTVRKMYQEMSTFKAQNN